MSQKWHFLENKVEGNQRANGWSMEPMTMREQVAGWICVFDSLCCGPWEGMHLQVAMLGQRWELLAYMWITSPASWTFTPHTSTTSYCPAQICGVAICMQIKSVRALQACQNRSGWYYPHHPKITVQQIQLLVRLLFFAFDVKYVLEEFSRLISSRFPFYLLSCGIQTQGEQRAGPALHNMFVWGLLWSVVSCEPAASSSWRCRIPTT